MKKLLYVLLLALVTQFYGCIVFNAVTYEVNVSDNGAGTATVIVEDINSDATTQDQLNEDIKNIFDYGLKSQEWLDGMEAEGKKITSRNLITEKGKLNAIVRYEFDDISKVEGMQFEDPYYYLTIPPEDSIISTNGQITRTNQYQRIIWDKSIKTLKFKMYSDNTSREGLKSMAPYYMEDN